MKIPERFDPYCYRARIRRAVDGNSIKLHIDHGFGHWNICTTFPGSEREARYPQGVYRLSGISIHELDRSDPNYSHSQTQRALERINELVALGKDGDEVLVKSNKEHYPGGKCRYMLDLYVPVEAPDGLDYESESRHWLSTSVLLSLVKQTDSGEDSSSTIRSMATEILSHRREFSVIHVNQQLLDEGLARPHFGGRKS